MALSSLFKKATHFVGGLFSHENSLKPPPLDGEIIYCKNNVCVHPPVITEGSTRPLPGYMTVKCQDDESLGSTLILTWIPNTTLKRNPRSVQNSPRLHHRSKKSPRKKDYAHQRNIPSDTSQLVEKEERSHDNVSNQSESSSDKVSTDSILSPEQKEITSIKSHTDSGVGSENTSLDSHQKQDIEQSPSTDSESLTTDAKLKILLEDSSKIQENKAAELRRERLGSGKSVSIEMKGDKLVITTTEVTDDVLEKTGRDDTVNVLGEPVCDNVLEVIEESQDTEGDTSLSSGSALSTPGTEKYRTMITELRDDLVAKNSNGDISVETKKVIDSSHQTIKVTTSSEDVLNSYKCNDNSKGSNGGKSHSRAASKDLRLDLEPSAEVSNGAPNISVSSGHSLSSGSTSGPDSGPTSPALWSPSSQVSSPGTPASYCFDHDVQYDNPESFAVSHNLTFPENSVTYSASGSVHSVSPRDQACGVFSVDLGQMRSLRLFYSDEAQTSGQLVIASRESQYKILHFHHGGLNKLADVLEDWNLFVERKYNKRDSDFQKNVKQFSVIRPNVSDEQCHPEEGCYDIVTMDTWQTYMTEDGRIEDDFILRKAIFFGGIDPNIRHECWPFLLQYYLWDSTFDDRESIRNDKYLEYQHIRKKREEMTDEEKEDFWKKIECIVEKDVVRTDRSNPYFKGENNPNIQVLQSILLNYAVANPHMGYNQGMSDLLAPILSEIQSEADSYWCFVGLMQRTIFISKPRDSDMDRQLTYLRELLSVMHPMFYNHIMSLPDASELLFCHRWILLCFKREFPEADALKIWEACWSHYQTDYFHLFVCLAIISVYGDDVIQQNLPADEMLLHFSSLAMHMSGRAILRKARGLLHAFRLLPTIPCTLYGLCMLCGPGMWDSGHVPKIRCVGYHGDDGCPAYQSPE